MGHLAWCIWAENTAFPLLHWAPCLSPHRSNHQQQALAVIFDQGCQEGCLSRTLRSPKTSSGTCADSASQVSAWRVQTLFGQELSYLRWDPYSFRGRIIFRCTFIQEPWLRKGGMLLECWFTRRVMLMLLLAPSSSSASIWDLVPADQTTPDSSKSCWSSHDPRGLHSLLHLFEPRFLLGPNIIDIVWGWIRQWPGIIYGRTWRGCICFTALSTQCFQYSVTNKYLFSVAPLTLCSSCYGSDKSDLLVTGYFKCIMQICLLFWVGGGDLLRSGRKSTRKEFYDHSFLEKGRIDT